MQKRLLLSEKSPEIKWLAINLLKHSTYFQFETILLWFAFTLVFVLSFDFMHFGYATAKKTEVPTKRFICESMKCLSATIQCHIFVGKHVKCVTKVGYELVFRFRLKEEGEIWIEKKFGWKKNWIKKENRRLFYY